MFATSSRSRRHIESAERGDMTVDPPPPGSDSCFGVRSLNGSVEWGPEDQEVEQADDEITDDMPEGGREGVPKEGDVDKEEELEEAAGDSILPTLTSLPEVATSIQQADQPHTSPRTVIQPILVPSPDLFLPTPSTSSPPASNSTHDLELQDPDHPMSEYSTDDDGDGSSSAPPSPTSLNSLPSYLASDISMPSSPGIGYSTGPGSVGGRSNSRSPLRAGSGGVGAALQALERERARSTGTIRRPSKYNPGVGQGEGDEDEEAPDLVIPTLSLPSSSLHLSLRPFRGLIEGVKIALIGDAEDTKAFLRALEAQEELVEVDRLKGWVGVMRAGELAVVLIMGLSSVQIKHKVLRSYSTLHDLLNPAATKGDQARLHDIISHYADKEDWIHGCLCLNGKASGLELPSLVYHLPVFALSADPEQDQYLSTRASTPSPPAQRLDDPTPMARVETTSYFSQPITTYHPTSHLLEDPPITSPPISAAISALQKYLDGGHIRLSSIDHFLSWRPVSTNLESSHSSIDTTSAGTSGAGGLDRETPMPTVARAQGGGEWEAGLSRRMAKRRETIPGRRVSAETPGKRRRSKGTTSKPITEDVPLFPTSKRSYSRSGRSYSTGLGVKDLLERTFAPVKNGLRGWRGVVLVAAVVGVVGLGWWFGRKT